jgi:epsilon-lactone hydrolase
MSPTRRARLARRFVTRMSNGPDVPLEVRRERMDRIDRLPRPRHVEYVDTVIGGVPAIVATPTATVPTRHILYIHGGAFVQGSPRSHIAFAANLARRASATASVIDYRLAPEYVYPCAIDDCVAAYRAMVESVDPALVTIAGDSAGGNAALATLCRLRDEGDRLPAAAYLLSPWTDLTGSGESVGTMATIDPMLDATQLIGAATTYAARVSLDDPGVSPLFADMTGLPPMLIQTGADEILLSDSVRLAERARAAGVDVTLDIAEGMWHVYPAFTPFFPEATDAVVRAAVFIRSRVAMQVPA